MDSPVHRSPPCQLQVSSSAYQPPSKFLHRHHHSRPFGPSTVHRMMMCGRYAQHATILHTFELSYRSSKPSASMARYAPGRHQQKYTNNIVYSSTKTWQGFLRWSNNHHIMTPNTLPPITYHHHLIVCLFNTGLYSE